jgi:hypothetical protein
MRDRSHGLPVPWLSSSSLASANSYGRDSWAPARTNQPAPGARHPKSPAANTAAPSSKAQSGRCEGPVLPASSAGMPQRGEYVHPRSWYAPNEPIRDSLPLTIPQRQNDPSDAKSAPTSATRSPRIWPVTCATAATRDRHVARLVFQSVNDPSAESARRLLVVWSVTGKHRSSASAPTWPPGSNPDPECAPSLRSAARTGP